MSNYYFLRFLIFFFLFLSLGGMANSHETKTKMRVHFIDVGQGDATLIEFDCGAIMVDAGGERWPSEPWEKAKYDGSEKLMKYLDNFFDNRPDLNSQLNSLVLTHPHIDHNLGVKKILDKYPPANIVHNGQRGSSPGSAGQSEARYYSRRIDEVKGWYVLQRNTTGANGQTNDVIDPIDCTAVDPKIEMLWGKVESKEDWLEEEFDNDNNHSLVVKVRFGDSSILFTGDLEESEKARRGKRAGIERLVEQFAGTDTLDVDVYQVGHHGSHNGTTKSLMEAMTPEIAVISAGPACRRGRFSAYSHGHPRLKIIELLQNHVSGTRSKKRINYFEKQYKPIETEITEAIYSTGWDGNIILEADAHGNWSVEHLGSPDACLNDE